MRRGDAAYDHCGELFLVLRISPEHLGTFPKREPVHALSPQNVLISCSTLLIPPHSGLFHPKFVIPLTLGSSWAR